MDAPRSIERLADRAWPAGEVVECGGWLLRRTPEVTRKRSNSALPVAPGDDGGQDPSGVESFYAERGAPAVIQVTPLECRGRLDAALAARGWKAGGTTDVLVAPASAVARTAREGGEVTPFDAAWSDAWSAIEARPDAAAHRDVIFPRIPSPAGFALVERDGRPAGVGLCAVEGGWGGLFCVATAPWARRQGVAREALASLAAWAAERGGGRLYLQVEAGNAPAQALFAEAGFTRSHAYHYRTAPS